MSRRQHRKWGVDEDRTPFLHKVSTHIGIVVLVLLAIFLFRGKLLDRPSGFLAQASSTTTPASDAVPASDDDVPELSGQSASHYPARIARAALPHTIIPDRPRLEIITYTVQSGDTIFGMAETFGVSAETIMWANGDLEYHPDDLSIGQKLVILPDSGVYHRVISGDTIEKLAQTYEVAPEAIREYHLNSVGPAGEVTIGQWLVIPGGEKPYVPRYVSHYTGPIPAGAAKGSGNFGWPATGYITQGYWHLHRAIDIGGSGGTPVYVSDSGYVVYAGWDDSGYGNLIIVDHGNGYTTYYAHLKSFSVSMGDSVGKGQQIGTMGSTGRSTGSHLHFEIRQRDVQRNPLGFLP